MCEARRGTSTCSTSILAHPRQFHWSNKNWSIQSSETAIRQVLVRRTARRSRRHRRRRRYGWWRYVRWQRLIIRQCLREARRRRGRTRRGRLLLPDVAVLLVPSLRRRRRGSVVVGYDHLGDGWWEPDASCWRRRHRPWASPARRAPALRVVVRRSTMRLLLWSPERGWSRKSPALITDNPWGLSLLENALLAFIFNADTDAAIWQIWRPAIVPNWRRRMADRPVAVPVRLNGRVWSVPSSTLRVKRGMTWFGVFVGVECGRPVVRNRYANWNRNRRR